MAWPEYPKKSMTRPKPSSVPTIPSRPSDTQITDNNLHDSYDRRDDSAMTGVSLTVHDIINNFVFPGSTNPHPSSPTSPPSPSTNSVPYDVQCPVPV